MKKIIGLAGIYGLPMIALAQFNLGTGGSPNPILTIIGKVGQILNAVVPIVITLALIYFIWGVAKYVTASSDEAKQEARDVMIYGAIGLFFIVSIWGIVALLQQFTGVQGLTAPPGGLPGIPTSGFNP